MLDQPNPDEVLDVVAQMLREQFAPQLPAAAAFHARVAANAIDLVRRQILKGEHLEQASHERLRALLGHDGPPEALERALCERIRDRSLDASTPGLLDHLMACTLAKMSIDQPSYASYRRALEEHPGHAPI